MFKSKSGGKSFLKKDGMKHLSKAAMHNGIRGIATAGTGFAHTKFVAGMAPTLQPFFGPGYFLIGTLAEAFISDKHAELHHVAQGVATYGMLKTIEDHVAKDGGAIPKNYHGLSSPSDSLNAGGFDWTKIAADAAKAARDEVGMSGRDYLDLSGNDASDMGSNEVEVADRLQ